MSPIVLFNCNRKRFYASAVFTKQETPSRFSREGIIIRNQCDIADVYAA